MSDTDSITSSKIEDVVRSEPMYFVLSQFLETPDGATNVASALKEIADQLKELNTTLKTQNMCSCPKG